MSKLIDLQKQVSAPVGILSFITGRAADLCQSDEEEERAAESPFSTRKHGCELEEADESVDETEFEDALDRIAEVLARFKTAQGKAAAVEQRNQDAKHVTSLEDASDSTATFFCAKNEGLNEDDVEFLRKLEQVYRRIAASGKRTLFLLSLKSVERLLDMMFAHQMPRVKHYANVLANTLEAAARALAPNKAALTRQNLEHGCKRCTTRIWKDDHDFDYEIRLASTGDDSDSDIAVGCLTDREGEELVQSAFRGILHHFVFPLADEPLHSRGTHLELFSLWALPASLPLSAAELGPSIHPTSAGASAALLVRADAAPSNQYSSRPPLCRRPRRWLMLGFGGVMVTDQQMDFLPSHQNPG
ncbi:hypothetical protein MY10362_006830 [Beauveria mimosiformis]